MVSSLIDHTPFTSHTATPSDIFTAYSCGVSQPSQSPYHHESEDYLSFSSYHGAFGSRSICNRPIPAHNVYSGLGRDISCHENRLTLSRTVSYDAGASSGLYEDNYDTSCTSPALVPQYLRSEKAGFGYTADSDSLQNTDSLVLIESNDIPSHDAVLRLKSDAKTQNPGHASQNHFSSGSMHFLPSKTHPDRISCRPNSSSGSNSHAILNIESNRFTLGSCDNTSQAGITSSLNPTPRKRKEMLNFPPSRHESKTSLSYGVDKGQVFSSSSLSYFSSSTHANSPCRGAEHGKRKIVRSTLSPGLSSTNGADFSATTSDITANGTLLFSKGAAGTTISNDIKYIDGRVIPALKMFEKRQNTAYEESNQCATACLQNGIHGRKRCASEISSLNLNPLSADLDVHIFPTDPSSFAVGDDFHSFSLDDNVPKFGLLQSAQTSTNSSRCDSPQMLRQSIVPSSSSPFFQQRQEQKHESSLGPHLAYLIDPFLTLSKDDRICPTSILEESGESKTQNIISTSWANSDNNHDSRFSRSLNIGNHTEPASAWATYPVTRGVPEVFRTSGFNLGRNSKNGILDAIGSVESTERGATHRAPLRPIQGGELHLLSSSSSSSTKVELFRQVSLAENSFAFSSDQ